jgi:hypothetical protein
MVALKASLKLNNERMPQQEKQAVEIDSEC